LNPAMQKVGLVINHKKNGARTLAGSLKTWLKKRGKQVFAGSREEVRTLIRRSDFLVCLGGDGTILNVAHHMEEKSIPVLGVNLGGLGFMTGVKGKEVFKELEAIFSGSCKIEERIMLRARLVTKKRTEVFQALNDAVINRDGLTRYLKIHVKADNDDLMSFSGDGVIVATPTGSTAYSLSAGGPFVYPTLDSFLVTPICAHALLSRPIVLHTEKVIRISMDVEKDNGRAALTLDGQTKRVITPGDRVEITKSPVRFKLIGSSQRSYLETLKEKFGMVQDV